MIGESDLKQHKLILVSEVGVLSEEEKNRFKEKCVIEEKEKLKIHTSRSDVIDYYKKLLKKSKKEFKILLKDDSKVLKNVYPSIEEGIYQIPVNKWSSLFYSRFNKFLNQKKSSNAELVEKNVFTEPVLSEEELAKKLIEEEWLYNINVHGAFLYSGKYIQLANKLAQLYESVMEIDLLKEEYKFSNLIPISELIKINYYYPHCANFHYHLKCNSTVEQMKSFALKVHLEQYLDPLELLKYSSGPNYAMNYCSCQGLWLGFKNKNFEGNKIKRFYDKSVSTYRDEKGKLKSLERLQMFERFEQIFLGDKEMVQNYTIELKEKLIKFLKLCNIPFNIVYGPNWFCEDIDGVGFTYDFEYPRSQKPLEIGNLSYNATLWTKPYGIRYNNKEAYSGCSGIGIQRLVYLYLLNNGLNSENWPIY